MEEHTEQSSPLLCLCARVTEREVIAALERGADDLSSVREATEANTGCGDCADDIEDLIAEHQERSTLRSASN
ncbi:bacterioferritin-associated ferredoxin [Kitasatospora sp. NPDC052896]|uniref:bacterioferritin-associated ferredoxin n=1 Tax=Kitasatospora sp. NPDC052896 TaxID=3364061 RepID=UPI0037CC5FBB